MTPFMRVFKLVTALTNSASFPVFICGYFLCLVVHHVYHGWDGWIDRVCLVIAAMIIWLRHRETQ